MRRLLGVLSVFLLSGGIGCAASPHEPDVSSLSGVLYVNEFMASNSGTAADESGDYDDWVELYNSGSNAVRLKNMYLTDDLERITKWVFPDTVIPAGGYLLVWTDGEPQEGALHASFKLNAEVGEQIGLYATEGGDILLVDSVSFDHQGRDTSRGRLPDGGALWQSMVIPSPEAKNTSGASEFQGTLFVNEFMASNGGTIRDEAGDYDDWIELYNEGSSEVSLLGMYLTDNLAVPRKWAFPDVSIPAGGYLLVWADDEGEEGLLHAAFNLSAAVGEEIGLYQEHGRYALVVDTLTFGPQSTDTSCGRLPDGGDDWRKLSNPTPGAANH